MGTLVLTARNPGAATITVGFKNENGEDFFTQSMDVRVNQYNVTLSASPSSVNLDLAGKTSETVIVSLGGNFPGDASLSVETSGVAKGSWISNNQTQMKVYAEEAGTGAITYQLIGNGKVYATATVNVTVTAPTYTVSYDANGGNGAPSTQTKRYHEPLAISASVPRRGGYTFLGWSEASGASSAQYQPGSQFTDNRNLSLFAVWEPKAASGTSHHILTTSSSDLGGSVDIQPASAKQGETVTVIATPRNGYTLGTVTATDAGGGVVRLTSVGGNSYMFTMPEGDVTLDVLFEAAPDDWTNPFSDVSEGAWYYDAVKFVSQNGLMNGSNGVFDHSGNLSRAMIAQILYNKEGRPTVAGSQVFNDVSPNVWYFDAISWAAENRLILGDEKGLFHPEAPITREQLAVVLWRYAGSPTFSGGPLNFTDAGRISSYAQEAVGWAVMNGIISGGGGGILDPQAPATRAQVAQMLKNYLE